MTRRHSATTLEPMQYAHVFRRDGINHLYLSTRQSVSRTRSRRIYTICALTVDRTWQRRVGSYPHVPVTCDTCASFMTALLDILEEEASERRDSVSS